MFFFKSKVEKAQRNIEKKEAELAKYCEFCRYICKKHGYNSVWYRSAAKKRKLIEAEIEGLKAARCIDIDSCKLRNKPYKYGILE